ncbi:MAG: GNAT family N-acetyltransferase [Bacteroidota bacterium]
MYLFTSERLGFRNWQDKDMKPFAAMNADPKVLEFFPSLLSEDQSNASVHRFKDHFSEQGFTFFAVDTLNDQAFIGFIGLYRISFESFFTPGIEIGWRLAKGVWGKGYATEGALTCLAFAFERLGERQIYSFTALQNKRSERVMQKIGMERIGEFDHPKVPAESGLRKHVLYKIEKPAP